MKKYIYKTLLLVAVIFTLASCETQEIETFKGESLVYFESAVTQEQDSISITFAFDSETVKDSLVKIPIQIQGAKSDNDREIAFRIIEASSAQLNTHFTLPEKVFIPANKTIGEIPVTFKRTADMKTTVFSLKLELLDNENFKTNLSTENKLVNRNRPLSYTNFEIIISDILTRPPNWEGNIERYLGEFSEKKLRLFSEVNGIPVSDFSEGTPFSFFTGRVAIFKAYLANLRFAGTPVLEEDGTEMVLGRSA